MQTRNTAPAHVIDDVVAPPRTAAAGQTEPCRRHDYKTVATRQCKGNTVLTQRCSICGRVRLHIND